VPVTLLDWACSSWKMQVPQADHAKPSVKLAPGMTAGNPAASARASVIPHNECRLRPQLDRNQRY